MLNCISYTNKVFDFFFTELWMNLQQELIIIAKVNCVYSYYSQAEKKPRMPGKICLSLWRDAKNIFRLFFSPFFFSSVFSLFMESF